MLHLSLSGPRLALAGRSALLLAVLALAGCDRFTDEPGATVPVVLGDESRPATPSLYLKGPAVALISDPTAYRSEGAAGAVRYEWSLTGSAQASLDTQGRDATLISRAPGRATLTVAAYDGAGKLLGIGNRDVTVDR